LCLREIPYRNEESNLRSSDRTQKKFLPMGFEFIFWENT